MRNQGRTDSGCHWCYVHWDGKHKWPLHFASETTETTAMMASFFNSAATFFFNPNVSDGESVWYEVRCVNDEWAPRETFIGLWSFEVVVEEV